MERVFFSNEIKLSEDQGRQVIEGYAAVYDMLSDDLGGYRARIQHGAFSEALSNPSLDCRALFNHSRDYVLGRTTNGTLLLTEDEKGLRYRIYPPDTTYAKDLLASMSRGDINQSSVGFNFYEKDVKWETVNGERVQTFQKCAELIDVSPVTVAAFPDAPAKIRTFEKEERRKQESKLRMMANRLRLALSV